MKGSHLSAREPLLHRCTASATVTHTGPFSPYFQVHRPYYVAFTGTHGVRCTVAYSIMSVTFNGLTTTLVPDLAMGLPTTLFLPR